MVPALAMASPFCLCRAVSSGLKTQTLCKKAAVADTPAAHPARWNQQEDALEPNVTGSDGVTSSTELVYVPYTPEHGWNTAMR
jgi:hypothetical protein